MKLNSLPQEIVDLVKKFPTRSAELLHENSYLRYVYHYLLSAERFLEIGYRKGMFVELCKNLRVSSVHIDITSKLLRATPTAKNECFTKDSISYLKSCRDSFDLIFQDGSKEYRDRQEEYALIVQNKIIRDKGIIIADDLHYGGCSRAFREALKKFGWQAQEFDVFSGKKRSKHRIGIIKIMEKKSK